MSTSTIDPRIKARRIAVQKEEGHKRLRKLGIASGVVATGLALWGLTLTPLLDVDHIEVVGATNTGESGIQGVSGIAFGDSLLTVDLGRAADRIAALPWVETVDVSRHWPGTVEVDVVERTPTAAAPVKGGGWVLLDRGGRQLAVVPQPPAGVLYLGLPAVAAVPGQDLTGAATPVLELAATRPAALKDQLLNLRPAPGGAVDGLVRLRNGAEADVRFGRPTQAAAKWLALLAVLQDTDPAGVASIDLRVPSAPALTRN